LTYLRAQKVSYHSRHTFAQLAKELGSTLHCTNLQHGAEEEEEAVRYTHRTQADTHRTPEHDVYPHYQ